MFDVSRVTDFGTHGLAVRCHRPEQRRVQARSKHWLAATLDEIGYGVLPRAGATGSRTAAADGGLRGLAAAMAPSFDPMRAHLDA